MVKDHGPSIKDDETYQRLRDEGASKEKAARIANAGAAASKKGGKHPPYEEWNRDDLYAQAQKVGIEGRSQMTKDELIQALRNH
ncbi:Rho termination factor [Thalassospira sp. TSL5-1]|nr:Rho termination factor [Thalassospira sp. TSL5-1]